MADRAPSFPKSLVEFEALRGIAAIVVLIHHFMLGFAPRLHGLLYPEQPFSLMGTPAFAAINGSAAVVLFFVLSGFVLTVGLFRDPQPRTALVSALKRWPRLAGTVVLANLLAGVMMAASLMDNQAVAPEVPSIWLAYFYNWPSAGLHEVPRALWEGATTFLTGFASYNSNLWTMYYEFWGSLIAIGCAITCVATSARGRHSLLVVLWLVCFVTSPFLSCFVVGVGMAHAYVHRPRITWTGWRAGAAVTMLVLLLGYHENLASGRAEGIYAFLGPLLALGALEVRVAIHTLAAALALLVFLRVPFIRRTMAGEVGRWLGYYSFPIYLTQILVICSASSMTFAALSGAPHWLRIFITFAVTVAGTFLLAVPLARFDRWWVKTLNRAVLSWTARFGAAFTGSWLQRNIARAVRG